MNTENTTTTTQQKQLEALELRKKNWKKITEKLHKWVKGKGDLDELTGLISENLNENNVEKEALKSLGVVGFLIDQNQLWRINASTNYDRYSDIEDLLEYNQDWITDILNDWRESYLDTYIEEWLGERQSKAIACEIKELLKEFEY